MGHTIYYYCIYKQGYFVSTKLGTLFSVIYTVPRIRPGTCGPILAAATVIYLVSW